MRALPAILLTLTCLGCGGGSTGGGGLPPSTDPWQAVTTQIQSSQSQFPGGLCVEILSPQGVVYSRSFGGFSNQTYAAVASSSKLVSATVLLQLVDKGILNLDSRTSDYLVDRQGQPWSGNMGQIRLRHLLSFTSGISGDVTESESSDITLGEAVMRIYESQRTTAAAPGTTFYYGSTHLRIAGRMAEVATGKTWRQLFDEQLRQPLGWGALSTYGGGTNPNPAGSLACTGLEYTRFLMMQLRKGLDGSARLLSESLILQQRLDAFGPATSIAYTPYAFTGRINHYGFGNWVETQNGQAPSASNPTQRVSSTGKFGWAPWIETGGGQNWAAVIQCQQADAPLSFLPSENLKLALGPLIPAALAQNPQVVRVVP
jgi:D-alanyl-D-alanine-carboxypeptidase/D-alanyl-D-alanine-endopeptidase